jgi:hypothetical protein
VAGGVEVLAGQAGVADLVEGVGAEQDGAEDGLLGGEVLRRGGDRPQVRLVVAGAARPVGAAGSGA